MTDAPFTVSADFDLAPRPGLALRVHGADVTVRRAAVPDSLQCADAKGPAWEHAGGRLLIRHPSGARFLIEGGDSIRYEVGHGMVPDEVGSFLFGPLWAALALQRGLLPLHASAVNRAGAVHAFTGPSGAGKSTLAASLSGRGLPFFTDDVLLLDPVANSAKDGGGIRCYGIAGLRLLSDAVALTDTVLLGGPVRTGVVKRWARPALRSPSTTGRLRTLHVLSYRAVADGAPEHCSIEPLTTGDAVVALYNSLHRKRQAQAIVGRRRIFEWLLTVATGPVKVSVFHRPESERRFRRGVSHLVAALAE